METNLLKDSSLPTVVFGVGGGIAAYKAVQVVRALRKAGVRVFVVPTDASLQFVGEQTWQELSENPVAKSVFTDRGTPGHIELARMADLVVVAPCTADLMSQFRLGSASNLLSAVILATDACKMLVPTMHTGMWLNPATQENVAVLRSRGFEMIEPVQGALSSGDEGVGRMPDPERIADQILERLQIAAGTTQDLAGKHVVITAGGTLEEVDPVRYIGNHSSGRQGVDLAISAAHRGADVTLVAGQVSVQLPNQVENLRVVRAMSALQMQDTLTELLPRTDILIMAAAVADYRPKKVSDRKLKKESWGSSPVIELEENPDILRGIAHGSNRPSLVIGFGAETGTVDEVLAKGADKARRKGADLLAVNRVGHGSGFGEVDNELFVMDRTGAIVDQFQGSKSALADQLLTLSVGWEA